LNLLKRIKYYLIEANKHIERIKNAKETLIKFYPFTLETLEILEENEKDKIDVLIFRFAKLQDLLGEKIFRIYFELNAINTNRPFIELLSLLEKEEILEVDKWVELRYIRNKISHEYPYNEEEITEAINEILKKVNYLIEVKEKIEKRINEIERL
jgi:hypothetical protein